MYEMEQFIEKVQVHAEKLVDEFQKQPKAIQIALGSTLALFALKVILPRRRLRIQGRRAVVTGAASGIGKEVSRLLAQRGWRIWACDLNAAGLEHLAEFPNVVRCQMDVSNAESCAKVVQDVSKDGGSLDALINVAGIVQQAPAGGLDDNRIRQVFEINTFGPMRLCRDLIPSMVRSPRGGWIVNVTSIGGRLSWPWSGVYSPSKGAMNLFSDCIRREALASNLNLRVTVIAPGPVQTPLVHRFTQNMQTWADQNPNNPFKPGIEAEAKFQAWLEERGWGVDAVAVSALDVANEIIDAVELENPPKYVFVARWPFRLLCTIVLLAPAFIGDRLLIAM